MWRERTAFRWGRQRAALIAVLCLAGITPAFGQTLNDALTLAYQTNRTLNAERAKLRGTDEGVPQALSGYRPQVSAELSAGLQRVRNLFPGVGTISSTLHPWTAGITVNQTIFDGFRTANTVRQAESQVSAGRELLRNVEQNVLLDAVNAYVNVARDQMLVEVQRASLSLLRETHAVTKRRYDSGDVTPTDVAQAEARMSRGVAELNGAEVSLAVSQATYHQVIGVTPGRLAPADPVDALLPRTREEAIEISYREHPAVLEASYNADIAQFAVKIAEAGLLPTISVQGSISRNVNTDTTFGTSRTDLASVMGTMGIPLYDGGLTASKIRQAKELMTQRRIEFDLTRTQVLTGIVAAWATFEGSRIVIAAAQAEARAAELALDGVRKEAQGGQRTTIDVLNALQDLTSARARLAQARRDRVVASYTLLSAVGRLDHKRLGLVTPDYEAELHYHQVRDVWHGLRTPDGK